MPRPEMPLLDAYLEKIGATNSETYVPKEEPMYTMRPLTAEELEKYEAQKAEHAKKMDEWSAKREKEMEEENGPAWELLCKLRAKRAEKEAAGITGPALITTATTWGGDSGWTIK